MSYNITIAGIRQSSTKISVVGSAKNTLLSTQGENKRTNYVPKTSCIPVLLSECVSIVLETKSFEINGNVKLYWEGRKVFDEQQTFRSRRPTFFSLFHGKVSTSCDGVPKVLFAIILCFL